MKRMSMRVAIDVRLLAETLAREGRTYVTRNYISRRLGVNSRTAGKILSRMALLGLARRYSMTTYEILVSTAETPIDSPRDGPHKKPKEAEYSMNNSATVEIEE